MTEIDLQMAVHYALRLEIGHRAIGFVRLLSSKVSEGLSPHVRHG